MKKMSDKEKAMIDRRNGVRANRVIAVKHRLIKRGGKKYEPVWSLSTTKNMSVSGILFMSPFEYRQGDHIQLEVVMSGMIDVYNGLAEVVRVLPASYNSFDIAAKYIEPKPRSRSAKTHLKK